MSRIERGLLEALRKPINPAAILIMAVYTLLWGFWIGNPFWDVFHTSGIYNIMRVFPEWLWGVTAWLSGLAMLRGVLLRSIDALTLGAFIGFLHWMVIATLYLLGNWQNTGGITSLMIGVYCAYIYLNLRLNDDAGLH